MTLEEKTTLYLTDFPLSSKITEQDILKYLSPFSESILQIKEDKKDPEKQRPLSFKVIFKDSSSANKCRIEMNLQKYKNKSIRIMWDEHDTSILYNIKNNLFFKGIPKNISPRTVYEYFLQFGDISSCKMTEDETGSHYGYGYVTFYNPEAAKAALDNTKEKQIEIFENNFIEISFFQKKNERIIKSNDVNNINNQKLYISNFPENFSTFDLKDLCKEYGEVQSCNIFINNYNKNFGLVQFSSEKEAHEVKNKLDGKEIQGLKLNVKLYQQNIQKKINSGSNLYIRNIPLNAKEDDLIKVFSKYGKVTSARIEMYKKDNNLLSKGFGYLSFDNSESAEKAKEELNGKYLLGFESWTKTLIIEPFLSKKERLLAENKDFDDSLSYLSYYNQETNENNISNINKIYPQKAMFNFNNINININQYNTNSQYINNINGKIKIENNQFNIFQQFPNAIFNYNQFMNFNFQNNTHFKNHYNKFYRRDKAKRKGKEYRHYNEDNETYKTNSDSNESLSKDGINIAFNKMKTEEEKREFLGEIIFKKIEENEIIKKFNINKEQIGKITGMIIGLPSFNEIIKISKKSDLLKSRIEEALRLMKIKIDE